MLTRRLVPALLTMLALATAGVAIQSQSTSARFDYPQTRQVDVSDDYHGTKVADPYRWLEDLDAEETAEWVKAENKITFGYLESIPAREPIRQRLTALWDYEKYGIPSAKGGTYFYSHNDGLQNQGVLFVADSLDAAPRVLLDPNKLSEDGTIALASTSVTNDGKLMAYGLASAGSDWVRFKVRDVETGEDLPDEINWAKFSGASWSKSNEGFYYSRYDEPKGENEYQSANYYHKLYYHRLGTPQSQDKLVYDTPEHKDWGFGGDVTEDGRFLIIAVWQGTERKNRVYYQDLKADDAPVVKLLDDFDAEYAFLGNDGPSFFFRTDLDAPRGRVIAIDINHPERDAWKEIIPQGENVLRSAGIVGDWLIASYLKDAHSQVRVHDLTGKHLRDVDLPGLGSAGGFGGERDDKETFYSFTGFTSPPTIYRYDPATGESTLFKRPDVKFDPADYETRQVFYHSKDGTRVPMFITHKKGLQLDGNNPTLLYGYGGFDIPITPGFSVTNLVWMEMGGVYASANLRGGGEYGREWHDAGRRHNKQHVFDDFIAAAEWLIQNKYTRTEKLAIHGRSNGGLLVGACMTQRPDLFGAAIPGVGVLDMLRFHKFTIGHAWVSDYLSSDEADGFKTLYAYSPLHNLKPGTHYPATLITTGDHDDRVVPSHSFKFAARLQECQAGDAPVLIRIETRAGHGAGKPTAKIIEEQTDQLAFLVRELGMESTAKLRQ
jgi:prolyl oligopeptidase